MIHSIDRSVPDIAGALFVAWNAEVAGSVVLGERTSVWFSATIRGDLEPITIGDETNIQDSAVLHVDEGFPLTIGSGVTVGHRAILHGCTIADDVLVGMGAIVLNGASIGAESLVAAGSLVPQGKSYPPRSLVIGTPAKVHRTLTDSEIEQIRENGRRYVENARRFAGGLEQVD